MGARDCVCGGGGGGGGVSEIHGVNVATWTGITDLY